MLNKINKNKKPKLNTKKYIKKIKKVIRLSLFLSLLEQVAGAFRAVQTVVAACQGSVVSAGYTPLRQAGGGSMPETHHTRQTTIGIYSF